MILVFPNLSYKDRPHGTFLYSFCYGFWKTERSLCLTALITCKWAKSKIGHHCDRRNFFFQVSFLSSQGPRHFVYNTWTNNHCTPQKHQRRATMIKHVTVASYLIMRWTEFCSKIPSQNYIFNCPAPPAVQFTLNVYYIIKPPTYFNKKGTK